MNEASNETGGLQLPVPEQLPDAKAAGEVGSTGPDPAERAPAGAEKAPNSPQVNPFAAITPTTLPLPPVAPQVPAQNDASATTSVSSAAVVDDGDLIEKEWVNKAKQIVESNRNDPYKQSEELTVFKADYMKKRYDKNIKLSK